MHPYLQRELDRRRNTPAGENDQDTLQRDVMRYYQLVNHAATNLRSAFSDDELAALVSALRHIAYVRSPWDIPDLLATAVEYAGQNLFDEYDQSVWTVEPEDVPVLAPLLDRVAALGDAELLALFDLAERHLISGERAPDLPRLLR